MEKFPELIENPEINPTIFAKIMGVLAVETEVEPVTTLADTVQEWVDSKPTYNGWPDA